MSNLGYLFYKDYYDGINWEDQKQNIMTEMISKKSQKIIKESCNYNSYDVKLGNSSFNLKTLYPGLLIGTGYHHETHNEGEFKLGFFFDYTTGLPSIPGSSIKGAVRSKFPGLSNIYKNEKTGYIKNIVKKEIDINLLETELFEGNDVFYDAFPIANTQLLGEDYITPHKDDPLKNPIPLKFLKVNGDVEFKFSFRLNDGILTKEEKLDLIARILLDFGVGAKTNVGYGQFNIVEYNKYRDKALRKAQEERDAEKNRKEEESKRKAQELYDSLSDCDKKILEIKEHTSDIETVMDIISIFLSSSNSFSPEDNKKVGLVIKDVYLMYDYWDIDKMRVEKLKKEKQIKKIEKKVESIKKLIGEI